MEIVSDNRANFIGAERELYDQVNALDKAKIQQYIASKGIKCHSNLPLAPRFGGVHDSIIKAAK